jgi:hypothetical protein
MLQLNIQYSCLGYRCLCVSIVFICVSLPDNGNG